MNFKVETAALRELGGLIQRAKEDVDAGKKHLQHMQDFSGGEGVINMIVGGHEEAYQSLSNWMAKLADPTLTGAAQSVSDAAGYYERTERTAIEKLDATYPETYVGDIREHTGYVEIEPPGNTGRFTEVIEPQEHLAKVVDYTVELDGSPNWWDAFSPMVHIGNAIEVVTGVAAWIGVMDHAVDPQAEIVKPYVGDWAGVRAAADVLRNVGHELNGIAANLDWASQGVEDVWQGNAGDGAAVYLMNLGSRLHDVWGPIDALAAAYVTASGEMVKLRDATVNVLNQIGDAAIEAALSAGVAGGSASTGIGAPVAGIAGLYAGYKIYRVVDGINEIFGIIGQLDTATSVLKSAQTEFGNLAQGVNLPALPNSPINAPK